MNKTVWQPSNGMILEDAADQAVKSIGHTLVVAGPGSGKTELLAQRASYLLETNICQEPKKILAISFKVDAADNLQNRVEKRVGKDLAKRFESRTFDSFAKSLLDRFRLALPYKYQPSADYNLIFFEREIKDIAQGFITERHPNHPNWQHEIHYPKLFNRLINQSLPVFEEPNDLYSWLSTRLWEIMVKGKGSLKSSLTFPMIARLTELILNENPLIKNALRKTYSHVFLDEFQDTTYVQYDLLKTAFLGSNTVLTAVGDDKQRIMGWAGAMVDSFKDFTNDFGSVKYNLILNHRSAPRLVEIQNVLSQAINENSSVVKSSDKWSAEGGICEVWSFNDHIQEAKYISNILQKKLKKVKPRDVCILVKQQEDIYAKQLIHELKNVGIQSRIEKEFQDLLSEEYVQLIINTLKIAAFKNTPENWQNIVRFIIELNGIDFNEEIDKMWRMEKGLQSFIEELRERMKKTPEDPTKQLNFITELIDTVVNFFGLIKIKNLYSKYSMGDLLAKTRENAAKKITQSYVDHQTWDKAILDFIGEFSIPVMTIHKSKGLEYDSVFFLGLEDNAFWSFKNQSESDIRAFFVALSRAKNEVYFTFSETREIMHFKELKTTNQSRTVISSLYQLLVDAGVESKSL
ncbi:UvrD-helicase domain-containing protein [Bacillus infantis]|uniref:UvrD-helicase domain-containing protein n=1 Tax=Bacillus infantis TaxID=324767 RepID=UPI0020060B01